MTAIVRRAAQEDGEGLYASWCAIREMWVANDRRIRMTPVGRQEFVAALGGQLAQPSTAIFVAEKDGRVVGFISGGIERNTPGRLPEQHGTISYLYVNEEHRREGLGRRLFEALRDWAAQHDGVSHVEMPVLASYRGADEFWRSLGFSPFIERLWAPLEEPSPG